MAFETQNTPLTRLIFPEGGVWPEKKSATTDFLPEKKPWKRPLSL